MDRLLAITRGFFSGPLMYDKLGTLGCTRRSACSQRLSSDLRIGHRASPVAAVLADPLSRGHSMDTQDLHRLDFGVL